MKPNNLIEHPEGGRFCEVFRSPTLVTADDGRSRSALTHIYFSLDSGEVSRFHRVASDEVWNLYKGSGIRIYQWDESSNQTDVFELSLSNNVFCHVVPAGVWQAAEPIDATVLVGCSVGPGFEFDDFELIDEHSQAARLIAKAQPEWTRFVTRSST